MIVDPTIEYLKTKVDIASVVRSYFPDLVKLGTKVMCPWHDDTDPSLQVFDDGGVKCYGCGAYHATFVHLVAEMEDLPLREVKDMFYREAVPTIPMPEVNGMHRLLLKTEDALQYLTVVRNLPMYIIKEFKLGYDGERVTLPIIDQHGYCVNVRKFKFQKKDKGPKVQNVKGMGGVRIFPENKAFKEDRLLLVEGEMDCLCARQFGLPAVTWTGGCNSWNHDYDWIFKNKAVWIRYDNDRAGREASRKAGLTLVPIAARVNFVLWSELSPTEVGKDITDWSFTNPVLFDQLANEIKRFKSKKNGKKTCPTCGQEVKE